MTFVVRRLPALFLLVLLAACRTLAVSPTEFERISRDYNAMLRWQESAMAASTYVDKSVRPAYEVKVAAAAGVKVVDYRVVSWECDSEKGEAKVKVELDYYILPSTRVKTVTDEQKWVYREEPGESGWRLTTLLPEFK